MSGSKASPFRRKWRCRSVRKAPFPVPVASRIGHQVQPAEWPIYKGRLMGKSVLVNNPEEVQALQQGFFGHSDQLRHRPRNSDAARSVIQQYSSTESNDSRGDLVLRLSLEESFFLSYGLGCLHVTHCDKVMNLEEMWNHFEQLDPLFSQRYTVYHHYRSLGWVVKCGIKFGVDYILYKEGPPFYHATYSVLIKFNEGKNSDGLTWSAMAGLNRLCERVAKTLVLCYISESDQSNASHLTSMADRVFRFQIQEVLINRWVSTEERKVEDNV